MCERERESMGSSEGAAHAAISYTVSEIFFVISFEEKNLRRSGTCLGTLARIRDTCVRFLTRRPPVCVQGGRERLARIVCECLPPLSAPACVCGAGRD